MTETQANWIAEFAVGIVLVALTLWFVFQGKNRMVMVLVGALVVLAIARMVVREGLV